MTEPRPPSGPSPAVSRGLLLAALLPSAVLAATLAAGLWGFSYDDAFITYRYAESWAAGDGLRFNPGEPAGDAVLGTTAPGWALVLGLAARVSRAVGLGGLGVPQWGTLLTVAALWWIAAALPALWLPRRSPYLPWVPLVFSALALTCRWNLELLGAETFAAAALAATAIFVGLKPGRARTAERSRGLPAGLLMGAAMVCRLDAALAALVLGLALVARRRRLPLTYGLAAAALVAPCLAWVWSQTGSLLPNTLAGKRGEAGISGLSYGGAELAWLERSLGGDLAAWVLAALVLAGAAALIGRLRRPSAHRGLRRDWPALVTLAGWLLLHELCYRLAGVPFAPWYHVAGLAALLGLAAWGAVAIASSPTRWVPALRRALPAAAALLILPLLLPALAYLAGTWGHPPDIRTRLYAAVASHLRATTPSGAVVASMEIGALGYYSARPVLDLVGLVDPEVVAARRAGRLPELVAERSPEHILVPPPFLGRELGEVMRHPAIRRRYRPAARFFDPGYRHDPVVLYRRVDAGRATSTLDSRLPDR